MLKSNLLALLITILIALGWLRLMDYFAHRGWVESRVSRKIIHIGTGPIFVLCWFFFNDASSARWLAALVPFAITLQFALIGLGILKDQASVDAMSRTGDRREILRGPLFYGIVFVALTLLFWRDKPTGIVALMMMCGGDGLADLVGKKFGNRMALPWSKAKTVWGSVAVFVGGLVFSLVIIGIFCLAGVFVLPFTAYILPVAIIAFACTAIESLPFKDVDNITVPLVAVVLGLLLF